MKQHKLALLLLFALWSIILSAAPVLTDRESDSVVVHAADRPFVGVDQSRYDAPEERHPPRDRRVEREAEDRRGRSGGAHDRRRRSALRADDDRADSQIAGELGRGTGDSDAHR